MRLSKLMRTNNLVIRPGTPGMTITLSDIRRAKDHLRDFKTVEFKDYEGVYCSISKLFGNTVVVESNLPDGLFNAVFGDDWVRLERRI